MTQPIDLEAAAVGPSDAELIAAVRGGDSQAYGALWERHAAAARNLARQHSRNDADADDLVAEAFAKVLQVLQAGGGPDVAFRAYLYTTLRRVAYDRTRAGSRVQLTDDLSAYDPGVPFVDPALEGLERTLVAQAYATLPERWQAVLWHSEVEELSPAEIAPILGLTANGVSALAYRAREGLRQAYLQAHLVMPHADGCAAVNDKLGAYARGGLSRRETAQVEDHLAGCIECRALVAELADVNHGMRVVIAPLILGLLGVGLLKGGLLLGGAAAGTAAAGLISRPTTAAGVAAGGTATAVVVGGGGATGAAAATSAAGWAFNPAALMTIAAAAVGVLGLSAVAYAMLTGGGGNPPGGPGDLAGGPGITTPLVPGTSSSPTPTSSAPGPSDLPTPSTSVPAAASSQQTGPGAGPGTGGAGGSTTPSPTPGTSTSATPSPTTSPSASPTPTPTPTPTPIGPVLGLSLEPLGDLVAGRSGVVGFTAGNSGDTSTTGLTADVTLPPGVTMIGTLVIRSAGRAAGQPFTAPFAVTADWVCSAVPTGAHCTGPDVAAGGSVTAYLNVTADPGSAGTTPVSVTVGAPGATSVTATGTTGVAASGFAASFAGRGHLGVTEVGAPLLSCPPQANGCADALARTGPAANLNNDNWAMVALDQDADKATQSSSAAQLALPEGAVVTWAGLYWSGNVAPGTSSDRLATISLAGPGATGYSTVTAARVETGLSTGRGPAYQSFADVTKVVAAGGSGTWWAADAAAEPGLGRYAGWSLVVVYKDPTLPEGSVSVVDGFSKIAPGEDLLLTLPGTAGLAARVGMVAWEGDAGIDGDILTLDGSRLVPATGAASETNVADSFAVGSSSANTLGVDAKPLSGALFAGPTAQVRAFTRQDVILLGVLTVSSTR